MTDEQSAAIERPTFTPDLIDACADRILRDDEYGTKGPAGSRHVAYRDAAWVLATAHVSEHPSDGPSAAEELREARRLLESARLCLTVKYHPAECERIDEFLARTSRFEK